MRDMRVSTNAKGENSRSAPQQHCQKWQWHASELFWKLRKVHFGKDYPLVNVHKKRTEKIHHLNNGKIHYFTGSCSVAMLNYQRVQSPGLQNSQLQRCPKFLIGESCPSWGPSSEWNIVEPSWATSQLVSYQESNGVVWSRHEDSISRDSNRFLMGHMLCFLEEFLDGSICKCFKLFSKRNHTHKTDQ